MTPTVTVAVTPAVAFQLLEGTTKYKAISGRKAGDDLVRFARLERSGLIALDDNDLPIPGPTARLVLGLD